MKKPLLTAFLAVYGTLQAQVVPNFEWVRNYSEQNSRENVPSAIDGEDNVIVCGYVTLTNENILVLKYDENGTLLWTAQYDNGGNDRANAVATDAFGNIYVTGQSQGTGTALDYVTIKYNSSGTQQWASRYNGPTNQADAALSIAIDSSGNVYVTGTSKSSTGFDYATIKYNSSGTQQWAYRYNGPSSQDDGGNVIKWDTLGNLYVTGKAKSTTGYDIVTLKINPSTGANIWTHTSNGSANLDDAPFDMALDNGDPVIAGKLNNTSTGDDYFVRKINGSTGVTTWTYNHDCYGQNDVASSIAMTTDGYFLVTGVGITSGSAIEYHTIKLNNSGSQQWVNIEATGMTGTVDGNPKLVRDFVDHMYVTGQKMVSSKDIYVYQITPGGNKTWSKTHDGAAHGTDIGIDFLVNSLGQLCMVGQTSNAGAKWDFTTIKISQTPVAFPPDSEAVGNLKFFPNLGQLYDTDDSLVTDIEYYNKSEYPNTYIKKNRLSYVLFHVDTSNSTYDTAQRIDMTLAQTNALTEIYSFEQNPTAYNFFFGDLSNGITNVKSSNRLLVPNVYPGIDLHYYSSATGLKMYWVIKPWANPTDIQLTFSGHSSINLSSGQLHIGSLLETIVWDDPQYFQVDTAFATSPTGYTIIPVSGGAYTLGGSTVSFNSPTYNPLLPLIIQVDHGDAPPPPAAAPDGNLYWSTYIGEPLKDSYEDMQKDANEDLLVCGYSNSMYFPTTPGFIEDENFSGNYKGIFSKYSHTTGRLLFSTYVGSSSSSNSVYVRAIDGDNNGNIYVVGQCSGAAFTPPLPNDFSGNYQKTIPHAGTEAFILRFNPDSTINAVEYFTYFGGSGNDNPYAMRIDHNTGWERIVLGGITASSNLQLTAAPPSPGWHATSGLGFILVLSLEGDTLYSSYYPGIPKSFEFDQVSSLLCFGEIQSAGSVNLPIVNPGAGRYVDSTYNGSFSDAFLTRFSGSNFYPAYSTFIGGNGNETAYKLTRRDSVIAAVGSTTSTNFLPIQGTPGSYLSSSNAGNNDEFIIKLGFGLKLRYSTLYGGTNHDYATSAAFDSHYNLYVGGYTQSPNASFAPLDYSSSYINYSPNGEDGFIQAFDSYNQKIWNTYFGGYTMIGSSGVGTSSDYLQGMVYTSDDRLFVSGLTRANQDFPLIDWNPGVSYYDDVFAGTTLGSDCDGFMAMFDVVDFPTAIQETNLQTGYGIGIYPNPNNGGFNLILSEKLERASISVYDNLGQLVYNEKPGNLAAKTPYHLQISHLSSGMYYIYISSVDKTLTAKFMVR